MKLTRTQASYFGEQVPDLLDYVADCIRDGRKINDEIPEQVIRNIAKGLRVSSGKVQA